MPVPTSYNPSAEPDDGFKPIPVGVYNTIITTAELTTAKAGHEVVVLDYQICEGVYAGKTAGTSRYNYLSIGNPDSEKATKAMGRYNALFDACKSERTGNTDDLLNKPFKCTWKGKVGEDGYPEYMHFPTDRDVTPEPQGAISTGGIPAGEVPEDDIPF